MAKLTEHQNRFLRSHKISPSELFDASGMRTRDYTSFMKGTRLHFAFGVTPCKEGGHTIRTKNGHCVQCEPDKISYLRRHHLVADVYIAGSHKHRLIKIGSSTDPHERLSKLNDVRYGGASDWEILAAAKTDNAGKVESNVHHRCARSITRAPTFAPGWISPATNCFAVPIRRRKQP